MEPSWRNMISSHMELCKDKSESRTCWIFIFNVGYIRQFFWKVGPEKKFAAMINESPISWVYSLAKKGSLWYDFSLHYSFHPLSRHKFIFFLSHKVLLVCFKVNNKDKRNTTSLPKHKTTLVK